VSYATEDVKMKS